MPERYMLRKIIFTALFLLRSSSASQFSVQQWSVSESDISASWLVVHPATNVRSFLFVGSHKYLVSNESTSFTGGRSTLMHNGCTIHQGLRMEQARLHLDI